MSYECDCGAVYKTTDAVIACQNARHGSLADRQTFCSGVCRASGLHARIIALETAANAARAEADSLKTLNSSLRDEVHDLRRRLERMKERRGEEL